MRQDRSDSNVVLIGWDGDDHMTAINHALRLMSANVVLLRLGMDASRYRVTCSPKGFSIDDGTHTVDDDVIVAAQRVVYLPLAVDDRPFVECTDAAMVLADQDFLMREWRALVGSALDHWWRLKPFAWPIAVDASVRQDRKLSLLASAVRYGWAVPDFVAANDVRDVIDVAGSRAIVAKAINAWQQVSPGRHYPTTEVTSSQVLAAMEGSRRVPNLVQHRSSVVGEYRTFVCGSRAITVSLERLDPEFRDVDIRLAEDSQVRARVCDDPGIHHDLVELAGQLDLGYSAFDWADTAEGLKLLDINPTGSWTYLADWGQDINDEMVDLLVAW